MKILPFWVLLLLCLSGYSQSDIQLSNTLLKQRVVAKNLDIPWDLDMDGEGRIWFSQRNGYILRVDPEDTLAGVDTVFYFNDVFESWDNSGMHAFALHPKFPILPYLYTYYTDGQFGGKLVRLNYSINEDAILDTTNLITTFAGNDSHNGARIVFENDSIFFLCMGDAYTHEVYPQGLEYLNGKVLRIKIDGSVPKDNPFGNYVWSLGHRNPQGLVFGRNGFLYSSEHGTNIDDELNLIVKGGNYGWPHVEGFCDMPHEMNACDSLNAVEPLFAWTPTDAPCGLAYFDHPSIPEWQNSLLQTFLKEQRISILKLNESGEAITNEDFIFDYQLGRLRDVMVASNGKIYYVTSNKDYKGINIAHPEDDRIIEIYNPDFEYEDIAPNYELASSFFPNPASNFVMIKLPEVDWVNIYLYDLNGKTKAAYGFERKDGLPFITIDTYPFEEGMYILKFHFSDGSSKTEKLVISKP